MTDRLTRTREAEARRARLRRRWLIRSSAAAFGILAGYLCPMLPEAYQFWCHFSARVVALFVGGTP
jgi:hypothetical protein